MKTPVAWILSGTLAVVAVVLSPGGAAEGSFGPTRLLGPFAALASDFQWVRFQRALLAGETARALRHAEVALELDPDASAGWVRLAAHMGFFLASPQREPDLARRRAWHAAALEVTRRGAARVSDPEELHLVRGLLLQNKAELDPEVDPLGAPSLWRRAAAAYAEAQAAGRADAELRRLHALERAAAQ